MFVQIIVVNERSPLGILSAMNQCITAPEPCNYVHLEIVFFLEKSLVGRSSDGAGILSTLNKTIIASGLRIVSLDLSHYDVMTFAQDLDKKRKTIFGRHQVSASTPIRVHDSRILVQKYSRTIEETKKNQRNLRGRAQSIAKTLRKTNKTKKTLDPGEIRSPA